MVHGGCPTNLFSRYPSAAPHFQSVNFAVYYFRLRFTSVMIVTENTLLSLQNSDLCFHADIASENGSNFRYVYSFCYLHCPVCSAVDPTYLYSLTFIM